MKNKINKTNITEWLCSTGFLFPRNEKELKRFEILYENVEINDLTEEDYNKMINNILNQNRK